MKEEILYFDKKTSYSNLTKGERDVLYSLRDDTSIIFKEADKGLDAVDWDREDYWAEAKKQFYDREVYQELRGDVKIPFDKNIKKVIRNRGDISHETLGYPSVNNSKLGRFYLLHNIHKQLHDVLGRPVISNSGIYTKNISPLLSIILNHLPKTLSRTLKIQMISYVSWLAFALFQKMLYNLV